MSPLVIQKAFEAKIPVLASDVYGNAKQIIHNKNGWFFKFNDQSSLINQLQQLMNNLELINTAKFNIKSVKSFELVAHKKLIVYKHVLLQE